MIETVYISKRLKTKQKYVLNIQVTQDLHSIPVLLKNNKLSKFDIYLKKFSLGFLKQLL